MEREIELENFCECRTFFSTLFSSSEPTLEHLGRPFFCATKIAMQCLKTVNHHARCFRNTFVSIAIYSLVH